MGQQIYFRLDQQCFKAVGPMLAHYWYANPPFANSLNILPTMAHLSVLLRMAHVTHTIKIGGKNPQVNVTNVLWVYLDMR